MRFSGNLVALTYGNVGLFSPPRILWAEKDYVAEGVGFEPTVRFPVHTLSKRAP